MFRNCFGRLYPFGKQALVIAVQACVCSCFRDIDFTEYTCVCLNFKWLPQVVVLGLQFVSSGGNALVL